MASAHALTRAGHVCVHLSYFHTDFHPVYSIRLSWLLVPLHALWEEQDQARSSSESPQTASNRW